MTRTEKLKKCKEILSKYNDENKLTPKDQIFMTEIFSGHPDFEIKKGIGIDFIFTKKTKYNNMCFNIMRIDGSTTDISYIQSVSPKDRWQDVKSACRNAIAPGIEGLRSLVNFGVDRCQVTGQVLTKENLHFDHFDLSFEELFFLWSSQFDRDFLISKLNNSKKDNETECYFIDEDLKKDFLVEHGLFTHLRPVTKFANLSLLKKSIRYEVRIASSVAFSSFSLEKCYDFVKNLCDRVYYVKYIDNSFKIYCKSRLHVREESFDHEIIITKVIAG